MSDIDLDDFMTGEMKARYEKLSSYAILGLLLVVPCFFLLGYGSNSNDEILTYVGLGLLLICLFVWFNSTYKALRTTGLNPLRLKSNFMTLVIAGLEFIFLAIMFMSGSKGDNSTFAIFAGIMWLLAFGYLMKQNYDETQSVKLTVAVSAIQFFAVVALGLYFFFKVFGQSKHQKVVTLGGRRVD